MEPTKYYGWGTGAIPIPPGVRLGWGARAIESRNRDSWDIPHDRAGWFGSDYVLTENDLDNGVREKIAEIKDDVTRVRKEAEAKYAKKGPYCLETYPLYDLYDDGVYCAKCRRSGGYAHIAIWLIEGTQEAMAARLPELEAWVSNHGHLVEHKDYDLKNQFDRINSELEWTRKQIGVMA